MTKTMNVKKGDTVKILNGKDRGKTGKIVNAYPREGRITVEGVNVMKKHARPKQQGKKGEIVNVPRPFPVARVMLVCPNCKFPTRTGFRMDGPRKVRYCKKCKATIV